MRTLPLKPPTDEVDWPMILAVLGLMTIGTLFIASTTLAREGAETLPWHRQEHYKQLIWYALGAGLGVAVCCLGHSPIARWSMVCYWVSILLLVTVLIPGIGTQHGWEARRWIDLGPFQFQPSEVAKLTFLLMMAHYLSRPAAELRQPMTFVKALGMSLLPCALILKEPDLGSALVFVPMGLAMMFVAGVPGRFLWRLIGGAGLIIVLLLADILFAPSEWQLKLEPYQRRRLMVYFGVNFVPPQASEAERQRALKEYRDASHNVQQALISVGSGGFVGKGWRRGTQNTLGYLPRAVAHNDFIFSIVAEESGFVGGAAVLGLYAVVLLRGLRIASQARDRLGALLAVGITALFFCHVFINIGMNIRLTPVTGIPLPLLSYGGTSVLCSLIAVGLLQSVYRSSRNL
ncbi:MAG: rod shape-determining protein RodA [Verrucomicrobia bacterium]|jgi:rod shape determining protein RodA|nr:rod shape-determining protein RodA [Verrucomicrobiota bacterium]OQC67718.1 MAG: Rod shape-determining protein RodA [Verrucomicrobia bacterium ADurb.Bin006]MDI9382502.1 FtsW/RodA/SpoVE family cell cycle protein [Verrucomicrobiota bacterium]NMD19854.1 rod shape-determining protein RodA [Verrucomicrobiota bacterium]HOA61319.1 FtsW/RodA/SpoVE family cell cycle protein [Verrucomicrobiota bacterium]